MARKTKEDTQATREGILDAAEACFHEHGVARTTLEMIGARAGYTRGAVYWHFKNKSEVLAAIVERVHLPFMQELERTSTDQRDTPVHDLRAVMIHSFIELSEDERLRKTMEIMLRSDASADTKVLTEMQQAGFRDALDRMERALRRAQDLGQLREGADPKIAARMLHATVLGVLHGAMVEPELMDLKRDGMLALDMTLAAYVKEGVFVPGTVPEPHAGSMSGIAAATAALHDLYLPAGLQLTGPIVAEAESAEYGACRFALEGHSIVFRVAKITPTKTGQFVTLWKRPAPGSDIAPLDAADAVHFVVIAVFDGTQRGQFIFSRDLLIERGVMSRDGEGGKRALRVYPPWSTPTAKDAIRTRQWQLRCFLPTGADVSASAGDRLRSLLG